MKNNKKRYGMFVIAIIILLLIITGITQLYLKDGDKGRFTRQDGEDGGLGNGMTGTGEELGDGQNQSMPASDIIRVLIETNGYEGDLHATVSLSAPGGLHLEYGSQKEDWAQDGSLEIGTEDARFAQGNIRIQPLDGMSEITAHHISRGYGEPAYKGVLELRTTESGIAMINELPLEEYLCKVVPSEMPTSYELEALKAQAVCARSYAVRQMADYGYPEYEAHVNDSADYQVYNNSQTDERAIQAVQETAGQTVNYQGAVATTYYYSTSCGRTTDMSAWGTEPNEGNGYLQSIHVGDNDGDYESSLTWYRWSARIPGDILANLVTANTGVNVGTVQSAEVTKRGAGDVALELTVTGDAGTAVVETENKIRTALGGSGYSIARNDGTIVDSMRLLPSAFFTIEKEDSQFVIKGGGMGHGIGMSQNGANEMAKLGMNYLEILQTFYQEVTVE